MLSERHNGTPSIILPDVKYQLGGLGWALGSQNILGNAVMLFNYCIRLLSHLSCLTVTLSQARCHKLRER